MSSHNLRLPSNGSAPSLASYKAGGAGIVHLIFTGQKEKKTTKTRQEIIRRVISPHAGFSPSYILAIFFAEGPCSANRLLQRELLLVTSGPKLSRFLMLPFPHAFLTI